MKWESVLEASPKYAKILINMNDVKTFLLGLDGADWAILEPLIKEGVLPNFAKLYAGVHAPLDSTTPPLTPPGWTSSVTGRNPGKHNVFDFLRYSKKDYDIHLASRLDRRCRAIWNYVSEEGGRVLVMNVPVTFPPEAVNGYLISGFGTPEWDCAYTYPEDLKKRILKKHPAFKVDMPSRLLHEGDFKAFCEGVNEHCRLQFQVFRELFAELKPHFSMFAFVEMDRLFHFFWKENMSGEKGPYANLFREHFIFLDKLLGEFLAELPDDVYVMVISDHGFGEVSKDIYINNWLRDQGFLSVKSGSDAVSESKVSNWKLKVAAFLDRLGLWQIYLKVRRNQLEKKSLASGEVRVQKALSAVDWSKTKAYFSSLAARCIRINLEGREPLGIVKTEEYAKLQDEIIKGLLEIRDEEGNNLITRAYKAQEVYRGENALNASDIYLEPRDGYSFNQGFAEKLTMPSSQHGQARSGDHRQFGVFMLQGPKIKEGALPNNPSLYDVTPTLLYLMDIPLSKDFDGRVLSEVIEENRPARYYDEAPYQRAEINEEEDAAKLKERLRDLGYL